VDRNRQQAKLEMNKFARVVILFILLVFVGYLAFLKINPPVGVVKNPNTPDSIASGRYHEFLKEFLKLDIRLDNNTVWISLTNNSPDQLMPSEESHRAIVCITEIMDQGNKQLGVYKEYFKRSPENSPVPSQQIQPKTTEKFGYDLVIPHGIIKEQIIYEDFSAVGQSDGGKVLIVEKIVEF